MPENLREFFKHPTHPSLDDKPMEITIARLKSVLAEMDVPRYKIDKLINRLEHKLNANFDLSKNTALA